MENLKTRKAYTIVLHGNEVEYINSIKSPSSVIKELVLQDIHGELDYDVLRSIQKDLPGKTRRINQQWKQFNIRINCEKEKDIFEHIELEENKTLYLKSLVQYAMHQKIVSCSKTARVKAVSVSFDAKMYSELSAAAKQRGKSINQFVYNFIQEHWNNK